MSATDYTKIVGTGPGKVAKKPKEITNKLIIARILSHLSFQEVAAPSSRMSLEVQLRSRVGLVALLPSGAISKHRIARSILSLEAEG